MNIIETKYGKVYYTLTSGDHVHLHTSGDYDQPRFELTVFGVEYYVGCHLSLIEGEWLPTHPSRPLYASRMGGCGRPASRPALKALLAELTSAWSKHVAPDMLTRAERGDLDNQIEYLTEEIERLQAKLDEKRAELDRLGREQTKLGGPL